MFRRTRKQYLHEVVGFPDLYNAIEAAAKDWNKTSANQLKSETLLKLAVKYEITWPEMVRLIKAKRERIAR